jgi:hypothetical protein
MKSTQRLCAAIITAASVYVVDHPSRAADCAQGNALSCYTQAIVRLQTAEDALAAARDDIGQLQSSISTLQSLVQTQIDSLNNKVANDELSVPSGLPRGTVLLLWRPLATIPPSWSPCGSNNRYIRISPNDTSATIPVDGGAFNISGQVEDPGLTYDGGRPANPGQDSRRSPSSGSPVPIPDLPAYTYVGCIFKP